jgi:histone H2B
MPPKPASTASKAPATAAKAPAKTTEGAKAVKKTAKPSSTGAEGEAKKKRRKVRKETYSSYIYKGRFHFSFRYHRLFTHSVRSPQTSPS